MKLDNGALKKQINESGRSALRSAIEDVGETVRQKTALSDDPLTLGRRAENASQVSENEDYRRAKNAQRVYLTPMIDAALVMATSIGAAEAVRQAQSDLESLKNERHMDNPGSGLGKTDASPNSITTSKGENTSVYEYQTRGLRDPNADLDVIRSSGGAVSHTETMFSNPNLSAGETKDVWGASKGVSEINFKSSRPEGVDMPTVHSSFTHNMDKSLDTGDGSWQEQLGVRMANANEIENMDGTKAGDFFTSGKGSPFVAGAESGVAVGSDIPDLGTGADQVKVLDMRLDYHHVNSADTLDISSGQQVNYSSVYKDRDGNQRVILSDGSDRKLDSCPVYNGRYVDPTTCSGMKISTNNLGEQIGTCVDGKQVQITALNRESKKALFNESSDGFMMDHAGSTSSEYVSVHHVSFLSEEKNSDGISKGAVSGFGDKQFKNFIKDGKIDVESANKAGYNVALTVANINGKDVVTGASFIKHDTDIKAGVFSQSTMRQMTENAKIGRAYEEALLGKRSMMPNRIFQRMRAKKKLNEEQKEFLKKAVKSPEQAKNAFGQRAMAIRKLTMSMVRMTILTPLKESGDEDLQRGVRVTRTYTQGLKFIHRIEKQHHILGNTTKFLFKRTGKLLKLNGRLLMKIKPFNKFVNKIVKRFRMSKMGGLVHARVFQNGMEIIQKAMKMGSANGAIAYLAYRSIVGLAGIFMKAPVSLFSAVAGNSKAGVVAKALNGKIDSILEQAAGIGNFKDLGTVATGLTKKGAKNLGHLAAKSAKKGANAVGRRVFRGRWKSVKKGIKAVGKVAGTPFRIVGRITKAVNKFIRKVVKKIMDLINSIMHVIKIALLWIALIFVIIILVITFMCYLLAVFSQFTGIGSKIKEFFKLGTNEPIEQVTEDGQPNVEPLVQILQELHNDEVSKILKKKEKYNADVVYDNGSKENYKECISALTIGLGQDYGLLGAKKCREYMKKIYNKSHRVWLETEVIEQKEPVYEKDEYGAPKEKKGADGKTIYTTKKVTIYHVHLNILRDDAVVSEEDAAAAVPDGGVEGGSEPIDLSDSEWATLCGEVKAKASGIKGVYDKHGYISFKINGKKIKMRLDCSGYVSACLQAAGIVQQGRLFNSDTLAGFNNKYVTRHAWNGDKSVLKKGDILVYDGHAEIFLGFVNGVEKGYNWGSSNAAKDPGQTSIGHSSPKCFLRVNYKTDKKKSSDSDKDTDSKKDDSSGSGGNYQKTVDNYKDATLDYNTEVTELKYGTRYTNKAGQTGTYEGSVTCEGYKGSNWNYKKTPYGGRNKLFSHAATSPDGNLYITVRDGDIKGLPSGTKIYIIAVAPGLFGTMKNSCNIVGQLMELISVDSSGKEHHQFCVVGDTKSPSDSTMERGHHLCHVTGGKGGANFFETIVDPDVVDPKHDNDKASMAIYGCVRSRKQYVKSIIVYDKNLVPGQGFFNGKDGKGSGSVVFTSTGSGYGGGAYSVDYTPITYNSLGDEVGATKELQKTLDKFVNASKSGKYKQKTMYDRYHAFDRKTMKLKSETIEWKDDRQHTLSDDGGKGTGLDFLRCVIYAKHGVSLPWQYKALKSKTGEHYLVKVKNGKTYRDWDTIKVGDLIIYKADPDKPLYNWNTIVFSYYGGSDKYVVAYLNEDCDFGNRGEVVKIPYKKLKKSQITNVVRVNGLTKEKRYLAYPEGGFGGFTTAEDQKHMNISTDGKKNYGNDSRPVSDVELFDNMKDNDDLWVDEKLGTKGKGYKVYPDAEYKSYDDDPAKSGTTAVPVYYYGYTEDDFKDMLQVEINYKDQQKALNDFIQKMSKDSLNLLMYHHFLPSTFITIAWYNSSQGTNKTLMAYNNPVGLTKWWPSKKDDKNPYNQYKINADGYLQFDSLSECVKAWMMYVQDASGTYSQDGSLLEWGNTSLMKLKMKSDTDYMNKLQAKGGKPYREALKQYLAIAEEFDDGDSSAYLKMLTDLCEEYEIQKYDATDGYDPTDTNTDPDKDKTQTDEEKKSDESSAAKNDADNLYVSSRSSGYGDIKGLKLDQNGDGKIDLNDLPSDLVGEVLKDKENNKQSLGDLWVSDAHGTKTKSTDQTNPNGLTLPDLVNYQQWVKAGRPKNLEDYGLGSLANTTN